MARYLINPHLAPGFEKVKIILISGCSLLLQALRKSIPGNAVYDLAWIWDATLSS